MFFENPGKNPAERQPINETVKSQAVLMNTAQILFVCCDSFLFVVQHNAAVLWILIVIKNNIQD